MRKKLNKREKAVMAILGRRGLKWVLDEKAELRDNDIPNVEGVAMAVMHAGGVPLEIAQMAMYGPGKYNLADGELGTGQGGLCDYYGGYMLLGAARLALRRASGDRRVEIGMKYPTFDIEKFVDKFRPTLLMENFMPRSVPYEVWLDLNGNVWSFEQGRTGNGGYAGMVAASTAEAKKWLQFLLHNPEHYIKDLHVGYNGLGGLGVTEWDEVQKEMDEYI